jgi:hypothetical protein
METNAISVLAFKCPACGALPDKPCLKPDGMPLPGLHSKRRELALGVPLSRKDRLSADLDSRRTKLTA